MVENSLLYSHICSIVIHADGPLKWKKTILLKMILKVVIEMLSKHLTKFCTGQSSDLPFGPKKIMTTFKPSDDKKNKTKKKQDNFIN